MALVCRRKLETPCNSTLTLLLFNLVGFPTGFHLVCCCCPQMSSLVLFGASGFLLYRLFVYRHFIGVNVEYPVIVLLMMAIISCSISWIGWRTARSMHQFHIIMVGSYLCLVGSNLQKETFET